MKSFVNLSPGFRFDKFTLAEFSLADKSSVPDAKVASFDLMSLNAAHVPPPTKANPSAAEATPKLNFFFHTHGKLPLLNDFISKPVARFTTEVK